MLCRAEFFDATKAPYLGIHVCTVVAPGFDVSVSNATRILRESSGSRFRLFC